MGYRHVKFLERSEFLAMEGAGLSALISTKGLNEAIAWYKENL